MNVKSFTEVLVEIQSLLEELGKGNVDAFLSRNGGKGLRGVLVDLDMAHLAQEARSHKMFPVVFLTKMLLNVFFANFATDAPFDFPRSVEHVSDFAKYLGHFHCSALAQQEGEREKVFDNLSRAIRALYDLIVCFNEIGDTSDMRGSEYLKLIGE